MESGMDSERRHLSLMHLLISYDMDVTRFLSLGERGRDDIWEDVADSFIGMMKCLTRIIGQSGSVKERGIACIQKVIECVHRLPQGILSPQECVKVIESMVHSSLIPLVSTGDIIQASKHLVDIAAAPFMSLCTSMIEKTTEMTSMYEQTNKRQCIMCHLLHGPRSSHCVLFHILV
jgi:hypothetical protein